MILSFTNGAPLEQVPAMLTKTIQGLKDFQESRLYYFPRLSVTKKKVMKPMLQNFLRLYREMYDSKVECLSLSVTSTLV
jgi:hypothetical protein